MNPPPNKTRYQYLLERLEKQKRDVDKEREKRISREMEIRNRAEARAAGIRFEKDRRLLKPYMGDRGWKWSKNYGAWVPMNKKERRDWQRST